MKRWMFAPLLLLIGCSGGTTDGSSVPTSVSASDSTLLIVSESSAAPAATLVLPDGTVENVFAGGSVEAICAEAQRAAYAHAEQLGYWNHPLTAGELLVYYQIRSGTVEVMIESLRALDDSTVNTDAAVEALGAYNDWVHSQAATIEQTGDTVSQDHGGILDTARTALGCGDLFDMN